MPIHVTESTGASVTAEWEFTTGTCTVSPTASFTTDVVSETTSATGVTIDGVLLKDGGVSTTATSNLNGATISGAFVLSSDTVAVVEGGTGSATAAGALTNLGAASIGTNADITSLNALTSPLEVQFGGTSIATATSNGLLYGNGTGAMQVTAAGTSGEMLRANASGTPIWNAVKEHIVCVVTAPSTAVSATSYASQFFFPFDGTIQTAFAGVSTAGTTNDAITTVDFHIDGVSIFTTKLTIDSTETKSSDATTPSVINTGANTFTQWSSGIVHVDAAGTTPATGLVVELTCVRTS